MARTERKVPAGRSRVEVVEGDGVSRAQFDAHIWVEIVEGEGTCEGGRTTLRRWPKMSRNSSSLCVMSCTFD